MFCQLYSIMVHSLQKYIKLSLMVSYVKTTCFCVLCIRKSELKHPCALFSSLIVTIRSYRAPTNIDYSQHLFICQFQLIVCIIKCLPNQLCNSFKNGYTRKKYLTDVITKEGHILYPQQMGILKSFWKGFSNFLKNAEGETKFLKGEN